MFDVKKALEAALALSPDRTRRGEFAQFLLRLSDPTLPVSQWRTVGGTADMIERFLTELGFGKDDYELYVSRLDPSVRDFRWGETGKYEALRLVMSRLNDERLSDGTPEDRWLTRFAIALYTGEDAKLYLDTPALAGPVTVGIDTSEPDRKPMFNVATVTLGRINEFRLKVDVMAGEESEHGQDDPWTKAFARAKHVLGDLAVAGASCAMPDPAYVETVVRTLGLVKESDCPPFMAFDVGGSHRYQMMRTMARYLRKGETLHGQEMLLGGIAPLDFTFTCDRNGDPNPMHGYMFQDAEIADRTDLRNKEYLAAYGFDVLNRDPSVRLSVMEFASDSRKFWTYVRRLYSAFFGHDVRVGLDPHSRLAACNVGRAWNGYGSRNFPDLCSSMGEAFGVSADDVVAAFGLVASPNGTVASYGRPEQSAEEHPVRIRTRDDAESEEDYEASGVLTREYPYEWYENVHRCDGPSFISWCHGCHSQASERHALRGFRDDVAVNPTPRRLREEANYDTSRYLKPRCGRYRSQECSPAAALVTQVGLAVRTDSQRDADGNYPVRSDQETAFWTGKDPEAHGRESYVSAVYSGIDAPGTHFSKLMASVPNPLDPMRTQMTPTEADEWLAGALTAQLEGPRRGTAYGRVIVVETNVKWYEGFGSSPSLWARLRHVAFTTMCCRDNDPRRVLTMERFDGRYPFWNNISQSFVDGVNQSAYLADIGSPSTFMTDVTQCLSPAVRIRYMTDSHDRIVIGIGFYGSAERQAAIAFRWATGLPFVEASVLARKLASQSPNVFVVPEGEIDNEQIAQAYWRQVLKLNCADNGSHQFYEIRSFGYGPWFRNFHRNDEPYSPSRVDYNGAELDPQDIISVR